MIPRKTLRFLTRLVTLVCFIKFAGFQNGWLEASPLDFQASIQSVRESTQDIHSRLDPIGAFRALPGQIQAQALAFSSDLTTLFAPRDRSPLNLHPAFLETSAHLQSFEWTALKKESWLKRLEERKPDPQISTRIFHTHAAVCAAWTLKKPVKPGTSRPRQSYYARSNTQGEDNAYHKKARRWALV